MFFRALLALDSYNRGYHPGIEGIDGAKLGDATITASIANTDTAAQAIGFHAIAYEWNARHAATGRYPGVLG